MPVRIEKPVKSGRGTNVALRDKETLSERVLKLVAEGMSLRKACTADSSLPSYGTMFRWLQEDAKLKADYQFALELGRDALVEGAAEKLANVEIRDEAYTRHGKRYEIRSVDKLNKANAEANFTKWQISRLDTRFAPKPEPQEAGAGEFGGDPRIFEVRGGLPDFPLGELFTDEEKQAEIEAARLPHLRRDGQHVADIEAQEAYGANPRD